MLRQFKLKDCFTILNLFLTFFSITLLFRGSFALGSLILFLNIVVIDQLDGLVARLTKSSNKLGKFLDSHTDFIACSVAPSLYVYVAYQTVYPTFAIAIAFLPLFFGVLRSVQQSIEDVHHSYYFIGFPRTGSGLLILAYLNSTYMDLPFGALVGIGVIFLATCSNLTHWPYLGNNKEILTLSTRVKIYLAIAIAVLMVYAYLGIFWDAVTIFIFAYLISPFVIIPKSVWNEIATQLKKAS